MIQGSASLLSNFKVREDPLHRTSEHRFHLRVAAEHSVRSADRYVDHGHRIRDQRRDADDQDHTAPPYGTAPTCGTEANQEHVLE